MVQFREGLDCAFDCAGVGCAVAEDVDYPLVENGWSAWSVLYGFGGFLVFSRGEVRGDFGGGAALLGEVRQERAPSGEAYGHGEGGAYEGY
jgi:hypothetical protein